MKAVSPKNADIILHIGLPKTGSSAIQKFCLESRKLLLNEGYFYPNHPIDKNGISGGHSDIFAAVRDGELIKAKQIIDKALKTAKTKGKTLILSNEGLHLKAKEVHFILSQYDAVIVAFFRSPIDSYFSSYNQMVKRHYFNKSIQEYAKNTLRSDKEYLFSVLLNEWQECFGEKLQILPYADGSSSNKTVLSYFLEHLDIDVDLIKQGRDEVAVNRSYCFAALELKRLINIVLSEEDEKLNFKLDEALQALSDSDQYFRGHLSMQLNAATYKALYRKFENVSLNIQKQFNFSLNRSEIVHDDALPSLRVLGEIVSLVNYLKEKRNRLYLAIKNRVAESDWNTINSDQKKLYELFDCSLQNTQMASHAFFNEKVVGLMPNFSDVDFLRETARVLWKRGDLENAYKLISRAHEKRQRGPIIKSLYEQIKKEYELVNRD